jgi:hypothetical protein
MTTKSFDLIHTLPIDGNIMSSPKELEFASGLFGVKVDDTVSTMNTKTNTKVNGNQKNDSVMETDCLKHSFKYIVKEGFIVALLVLFISLPFITSLLIRLPKIGMNEYLVIFLKSILVFVIFASLKISKIV